MKKLAIVALGISLMSTKCADKTINFVYENKSNRDVVLSCTREIDSLKMIILERNYHDPCFKLLKANILNKDTLGESDLHFYSGMKNRDYYTYYFFRIVKFNTLTDKHIFEPKYDSINIDKEKIRIGVNVYNVFEYDDKKIVFKVSK
jgi:hypothetical protein